MTQPYLATLCRVTVKSKPDGRTFRRFKSMGTRASYVVAYVDATTSFRSKMRIEKVGNIVGAAVSRGREVVFHRLKISSKIAIVAEIDVEKVKDIKTPGVAIKRAVRPWDIFGLLQ